LGRRFEADSRSPSIQALKTLELPEKQKILNL
jgi:hypothetical protein